MIPMHTHGIGSTLLLIGVNLLWIGGAVALIVWIVRRGRADNTLDPAFQGYPVASGTVVDRAYQSRIVNERYLYRVTYRVRTGDGSEFEGWEDKYLARITQKARFDVGTVHQVAYRPGAGTEVRALP